MIRIRNILVDRDVHICAGRARCWFPSRCAQWRVFPAAEHGVYGNSAEVATIRRRYSPDGVQPSGGSNVSSMEGLNVSRCNWGNSGRNGRYIAISLRLAQSVTSKIKSVIGEGMKGDDTDSEHGVGFDNAPHHGWEVYWRTQAAQV
jgi:hypothetical protein